MESMWGVRWCELAQTARRKSLRTVQHFSGSGTQCEDTVRVAYQRSTLLTNTAPAPNTRSLDDSGPHVYLGGEFLRLGVDLRG